MGKYLVIRSCFRAGSLYKEGQVKELSDEMAQKHPKDFRLLGQEPKPLTPPEAPPSMPETSKSSPVTTESNPLVCKVCGKECKSAFGLKVHQRSHSKK